MKGQQPPIELLFENFIRINSREYGLADGPENPETGGHINIGTVEPQEAVLVRQRQSVSALAEVVVVLELAVEDAGLIGQ
ncbi:hypothetical protein D3C81_2182770 [compost metagenome]